MSESKTRSTSTTSAGTMVNTTVEKDAKPLLASVNASLNKSHSVIDKVGAAVPALRIHSIPVRVRGKKTSPDFQSRHTTYAEEGYNNIAIVTQGFDVRLVYQLEDVNAGGCSGDSDSRDSRDGDKKCSILTSVLEVERVIVSKIGPLKKIDDNEYYLVRVEGMAADARYLVEYPGYADAGFNNYLSAGRGDASLLNEKSRRRLTRDDATVLLGF